MTRRLMQVDVFTDRALLGNPVAVVLDAEGLDDDRMAAVARWTNLSETTFLLPPTTPGADYRVRIFTPAGELPFAGHPTLGTCHAWLTAGIGRATDGRVVQECGVGLVTVRHDGQRLAFAAPPRVRSGPVDPVDLAAAAAELGIGVTDIVDAAWADNGPGWMALLLRDRAAVLALAPTRLTLKLGVAALNPEGHPHRYEVRAFFPVAGMSVEDPVTGSLNASLAQWLVEAGMVRPPYVAAQGTALRREGRIHIDRDADGTIWVGGDTITCIEGVIRV